MARIRGTTSNDTINSIATGATNLADSIFGLGGNDNLAGLDGADYVDGGTGNDTISGGNGNDRLFGYSGTDTINSGNDNDFADGGADNDTINGDAGNDNLLGNSGNDTINGGTENDTLTGGIGNDTMDGGTGDDRIVAGAGADSITGGSDTNVVDGTVVGAYSKGGDWLSYGDASAGVTIALGDGTADNGAAAGLDTWTGIEHLEGSRFRDNLTASNTSPSTGASIIAGGAGNDTITAGTGTVMELMRGDAGYDVLNGAANNADGFYAQYDLGLDRFENLDNANVTVANRDKIVVSKAMFKITVGTATATPGNLDASVLEVGTSHLATAATTRFIFESDTKILWADLDGSGSLFDSVAIATIDDVSTLSNTDFLLIA